ncbi:hypothetical protein [Bradyrhizobium cosmicum]|uniref:Uncharacterized protein n=1 Tax=Bradyrhizobium cosmicum TaxID=1404864 RepID=A0AAI8MIR0_9BRAD|nr:hypothetical protein [Bradyrhizobium cosmicum]BAL78930.1 hypothetical protein S23_57390 [Bradyrhizobium cosmicum]
MKETDKGKKAVAKKKKAVRSVARFTTLDDVLGEEGKRMKTSRSQIERLLDPKDGNVPLATLRRAARMVGLLLRLELV